MAVIGSFGTVTFEVSDQRVFTFDKLSQTISGSWSDHKIIGQKPRKEFNGAELRKITFQMSLNAMYGIRPRSTLEAIEELVESGIADYLVVGGKAIGENKFVITSISETWDTFYSGGELAYATLNVTMEEYTEEVAETTITTNITQEETAEEVQDEGLYYEVKSGDTLWMIANTFLGSGSRWTEIYNLNKDIIEQTAKSRGLAGSSNGHWIFPGTKLSIPKA